MADSTLDMDKNPRTTPPPGHGTSALGPSDSTDSGSDMVGVGGQVGDANLDSDTDRNGTGERAAVGNDSVAPTDTVLHDSDDDKVDAG